MVFSSIIFLFAFLPIVLTVYFGLRGSAQRNLLLLGASLLFYAWGEAGFVLLLLASIALNYVFGLLIDRFRGRRSASWILGVGVGTNLALLGAFKYANFAIDNINPFLEGIGLTAIALDPVHLPIGISFFTFQALTYIVDVHRRDAPVQRNPLHVALYISLFPQLIAGPIVRYHQVAAELLRRTSRRDEVASGVRRFLVGLGKKVLIANTLAVPADQAFAAAPGELTLSVAWIGVICYALQIYFDFSGYSDMAIGLGRIFGFHFPENFRYPYVARSIREFWRRWHISLSTWFRDYLFIPLGGSRGSRLGTYANLFLVFLLCGLWHGASWNFVVWGLLHGAFLVLERAGLDRVLDRLWWPIRNLYALLIVLIAWVFFRAETLGQAVAYLQVMLGSQPPSGVTGYLLAGELLQADVLIALAAAVLGSTPLVNDLLLREPLFAADKGGVEAGPRQAVRRFVRLVFVYSVLFACAMALAAGTHNPFIYFRF